MNAKPFRTFLLMLLAVVLVTNAQSRGVPRIDYGSSDEGELLLSSGQEHRCQPGGVPGFSAVALGNAARLMASFDNACNLLVWELGDHAVSISDLGRHSPPVTAMVLSRNGRRLFVGTTDGSLTSWEFTKGGGLLDDDTRKAHIGRIFDMKYHPRKDMVVSGSADGSIVVRHTTLANTDPPTVIRDESTWFTRLSFSPDGRYLAAGTNEGTVWVWNFHKLINRPRKIAGHQERVTDIGFSSDAAIIAVATRDFRIRLYDMGSSLDSVIDTLRLESMPTRLVFSHDRRWLAVGSIQGQIYLWDMEQVPAQRSTIRGHRAPVLALAFDPRDETLVSIAADGSILRSNPSDGSTNPIALRSSDERR